MTLEERMMLAATAGPSNAAADPTDADLMDVGYQSSSLSSPGNLIATLAKSSKEEGQSGQGAGGSRASSSSGSSDTWLAAFYKVGVLPTARYMSLTIGERYQSHWLKISVIH